MIKASLIVLFLLWAVSATGQSIYQSNNNHMGGWLDNTSWTYSPGGIHETPSNPPHGSVSVITVNGYITSYSPLDLSGPGPSVSVEDTLVVMGDLILNSSTSLNIESTGVLVVIGNFNASGGSRFGNNGRVVVSGNMQGSQGASLDNSDDLYVFGTTSVSGGSNINGCTLWGSCDPAIVANAGDESTLNANDPTLTNFLESLNVLPVELVSFQAKTIENKIMLEWTTASELNNDYFEVYRSGNGTDFYAIGSVDGHGTTYHTIRYIFTDPSPLNGVNYYRLKQYDFDGAFEYSPIAREFFNLAPVTLKVFPNPASQRVNIVFDQRFLNTKVQLKLYDSKGLLAVEQEIAPSSFDSAIELNELGDPGVYILHVSNQTFEEFNPILVTP